MKNKRINQNAVTVEAVHTHTSIFKKQRGITLIALVVTIIVLLLLAGISITTLTGENGILKRALESKEVTELTNVEEEIKLAILGSFFEDGVFSKEQFEDEIEKNGGTVISEDEDEIVVQIDKYEATIDVKTGEIIDIGVTSITVKCEITPEKDIKTTKRTIKIIAESKQNGIKSIQKPDGSIENASEVTYEVTENGKYEFIIKDNAGNEKKKSVIIKSILLSVISITKEITPEEGVQAPYRNIKIIAKNENYGIESITKPDGTIINGEQATYEVTKNGDYKFVVKDNTGQEIEENITINNVTPIITVMDSQNKPPVASEWNFDANMNCVSRINGRCIEMQIADFQSNGWAIASTNQEFNYPYYTKLNVRFSVFYR